jgi:hypothetical protein
VTSPPSNLIHLFGRLALARPCETA